MLSEPTVTENQIETYGPYQPRMQKIALFTVANDCEAHGYPMPPHTDSLLAQNWCRLITQRLGAPYAAHIPYCTDSAGEIARRWSPRYLPFDEFYDKLRDFVKWHVERLSFQPEKVAIIIGHGGNRELPERQQHLSGILGMPVQCLLPSVSEPLIYPEFEALDVIYDIAAKGGEHAYMLEYSLMAHLGHFDFGKLQVLNEVAERDPLEALRRWPAIAGLGGFIEFGGREFDPLRDIGGLVAALEDFKKRRKIIVDAELGRRATVLIVDYFCECLEKE
ncbi:MAG: hypothetical protein C4520_00755 [Candidatus Abyssobacteria bacterium SURF_5]|uniref:Creatininase family protein n=1 Tax=Abyssobacteria bacterium (strain SURF_5) TaxID=2093360 RepID=A0A3A4PAC3_ABYX5|nr:MAG: hypothetical protein C4520_00755 [Candidatus Abyssubacteria bacterium SURF_5]